VAGCAGKVVRAFFFALALTGRKAIASLDWERTERTRVSGRVPVLPMILNALSFFLGALAPVAGVAWLLYLH